jgi:hypothetical protein
LTLAGVAAPALMLGEREETKDGLLPVAAIKYYCICGLFVLNFFLIDCISLARLRAMYQGLMSPCNPLWNSLTMDLS